MGVGDKRIELRRSANHIVNYTIGEAPILERSLSVYDFIGKKYTHRGFIYDSDDKTLKIPSTIDIEYVLDKLCSDGIIITNIENKFKEYTQSRRISGLECKIVPRDKTQKEAIDFLVATDASDKHRSHRLLTLDVGYGKTVCAVKACSVLQMPTVVTSVNLSDQWVARIDAFTNGVIGTDIIYVRSWEEMESLMAMKKPPLATFYVIGLDTMVAGLRRDKEMLHNFYERFGVGIQIFDECHSHFLKIINVLVNTSVERVIFLSATPSRGDKSQDNLYRKLFRDNVPSYGVHTHELKKFNVIMMRFQTKPAFGDLWRIQPRRGVHAVNYFKYIMKNTARYYTIVNIISYFSMKCFRMNGFDPDTKILIYVQSLELIKRIISTLRDRSKSYEFIPTYGDYSGNIPKGPKREKELHNNIIFTTLAIREGVDIAGLKMIINFVPLSGDDILRQIRGRLRDTEAWYVDAYDGGFEGMVRQANKRILNHKRNTNNFLTYEITEENKIIKMG